VQLAFDAPAAWCGPRFHAAHLAYRRQQEREADAAAAAVTSKEVVVSALARLAVLDPLYAEWGEAVTRESVQMQHPPEDLPERGARAIASPDVAKAERWLDRERKAAPAPAAQHPTLSQRWQALAVAPIMAPLPPPAISAWEAWLGEARPAVTRKLALWWAASVENYWQQCRAALHHAEAVLREPEPPAEAPLAEREQIAWERAMAALQLHGKDAARPMIEAVLALNPHHEEAARWMAGERLDADDETAVALLRDLPPSPDLPGLWLQAAGLYARAGKADDELRACEEADTAEERLRALNEQCGPLRAGDVIAPHTLASGHAALLVERAALLPPVTQVAVVRKELRAKPKEIFHLIAIKTGRAKMPERNVAIHELARALHSARLPGLWRIVPVAEISTDATRVIFEVPGACLYDRRHATR
jgi:hypothetical protein